VAQLLCPAAARKDLTTDEQGELRKLWKKLVNLYHPDRFAHEPDKLATTLGLQTTTGAVATLANGADAK